MTPADRQNIMQSIAENTERLDLLKRTLQVEERQKKRLLDLTNQRKKEMEEADRKNFLEGNLNTVNFQKEEAERDQLIREMVQNSSKSDGPAVKVLVNIQGIKNILTRV